MVLQVDCHTTLLRAVRDREMVVVEATSADDGQAVVLSDPSLQGILLDWTLSDDDAAHDKAQALVAFIRSRHAHVPIFLLAKRDDAASLRAEVTRKVDELIWILEDTTFFIIAAAYSVHHGDNHAHAEAVNA